MYFVGLLSKRVEVRGGWLWSLAKKFWVKSCFLIIIIFVEKEVFLLKVKINFFKRKSLVTLLISRNFQTVWCKKRLEFSNIKNRIKIYCLKFSNITHFFLFEVVWKKPTYLRQVSTAIFFGPTNKKWDQHKTTD